DYTEPLRLSLSWAVAGRMIPINPLASARLPKAQKRQQKILTDMDVEELISAASSSARRCRDFRIPLMLALYGGLRREECAGLTWDLVDFDRNRITIREVITMTPDGKEHRKDPKTVLSARTISMPAFVMEELKAEYQKFLSRSNDHTLKHNPGRRVCVTSVGDPYSLKSYAHAILRLIREINQLREKQKLPRIPEASFHDLRHTHAAMLIRRGVQPKIISERLGHSSIKITMDLYGYLMPGLQDSVADLFDQERKPKSAIAAG
ncbi:MAG: site-specific integrase, partial [Clostridia bacterium]|nr:site-specific integrase [Clostridia bacterium]